MGKKRFSGWSVVAAMFLFSFFATAIYSNCLSLYMHPVCDSLQLSGVTVKKTQKLCVVKTMHSFFRLDKIDSVC